MKRATVSLICQIMQCTVTYTAGMYSQLSKISSPIKLLILDICHADIIFTRGSVAIFLNQKGFASIKV